MERNWLIRTAQNQILGPVAKQKLLEFIQKGALGMMDEVTSGNGYWFSLKEKELVEKYLHGDLPQGYNPISESRSVVSRKDNPDKTTSINTAPANNNITQIIKLDLVGLNAAVPKADDLELPNLAPVKKAAPVLEDTKLPNQDDLEFPDIDLISSSVNASFKNGDQDLKAALTSAKIPMPIPKPSHVQREVPVSTSTEDIILPADDDLAFPDMDDLKTSTKIDKDNKIDLSHQYTRTVALDIEQAAEILPFEEADDFSFEVTRVVPISLTKEEIEKTLTEKTPGESPLKLDRGGVKATGPVEMPAAKKERLQVQAQVEDKKLLHDRKTKSSVAKGAALRDPSRENHKEAVEPQKRNDNYIFFILIILILIIVAVFFYFKEILNKPLPV
ncbi:hypothetical protein SHI21_04980 [Bacteriovorax sp. PP10]|uniref:GYF domain-containing protein n=1 Tax=Bacteriovorax antarcticus TaxID=3088717 RepID=A0ABU5VT23_9BACT|nr:hypothetical protein [Bacteriovorax sp. PP10]MEA9355538.1 hypothetical protein [Bacteriovorax sp. PP10]